ncbi:MAG: SDR family oxidoreductase [Cyanobacteriota/Melainabacteria group bacterium]
MSRKKRILVAGATGYLGGYVASGALDKGYRVLALARDRAKAEALEAKGAEILVADACDRSSLTGQFEAVDVLVSSIGLRSMKASPSFEEVDFRANMNLLEEGLAAGVGHFIFVSVLKGEQLRGSIPLFDARERVVDALKVSGMKYTVVRPNGFFNDMAAMFIMAKQGRFVILGKVIPESTLYTARTWRDPFLILLKMRVAGLASTTSGGRKPSPSKRLVNWPMNAWAESPNIIIYRLRCFLFLLLFVHRSIKMQHRY